MRMSKAVECIRCHAQMGSRPCAGCHPFRIPAAKLVSGRTQTELLDGPQVGKGSSPASHYAQVPEMWVLGVVRNPAKPGWFPCIKQEFKPTAESSCCPDWAWAGGSHDITWSCFL